MNIYIPRFGRYPIFHITNFLVVIYYMFFMMICGLKNPLTYVMLVFSVLVELSLIHPFWEKYYIDNDIIYTKKLKTQYNIPIPDDAILVFSYTTTNVRYNDRFMVNIITSNPNDILQKLHSNSTYNRWESLYRHKYPTKQIYDNKFVEGRLKGKYLYSFVYDYQNFQENFQTPNRTIVIPRSIYARIKFNKDFFNTIIDENA